MAKNKNRLKPVVQVVAAPSFQLPVMLSLLVWGAVAAFFCYRQDFPQFGNLAAVLSVIGWPTPPALLQGVSSLLLAGWLAVLMVLTGRWMLRLLRFEFLTGLETALFSAGMGAGGLIFLLLLLGFSGLWNTGALIGACLALTVAGAWANRDLLTRKPTSSGVPEYRWHGTEKLLLTGLIFFLFISLFEALAPEIFYDSLVYHLAVPKLWLLEHRIVPTPTICFSGSPFNIEVLYGLGMALHGDVLAKLIHFTAGLASLGMIYALARRYASPRAGLLACLLFVSPPMVGVEFGKTAVEFGSTFFSLLAVGALLQALSVQGRRWYLLSGIFCGLAMGTKYTVWVLGPALCLTVFVVWWVRGKKSTRDMALGTAWMSAAALAVVSPWVIKNIIFYRNPLYPFLNDFFVNPANALSNWPALQSEAGRNLREILTTWKGFSNYLLEPWKFAMRGKTDADFIGPGYLVFLPWILLLKNRAARGLGLAFLLQWMFYSLLAGVPRFWIPPLAFLAVLIGVGLTDPAVPQWARRIGLAGVLWVAVSNLMATMALIFQMSGWEVTLGKVERGEYLRHFHSSYPTPYYGGAEFINKNTPKNSRVLVLGDGRAYFLERPFTVATVYDTHPLYALANASQEGDDIYRALKEQGFTHFLFNVAEGARVRTYRTTGFTLEGAKRFDQFWQKHLRPVYEDVHPQQNDYRYVVVYEMAADRALVEPHPAPHPDYFLEFSKVQ